MTSNGQGPPSSLFVVVVGVPKRYEQVPNSISLNDKDRVLVVLQKHVFSDITKLDFDCRQPGPVSITFHKPSYLYQSGQIPQGYFWIASD